MAFAFRIGGQFESALRWYDEALKSQPEALELLVGCAECLFQLGSDAQTDHAMEIALLALQRTLVAASAVPPW